MGLIDKILYEAERVEISPGVGTFKSVYTSKTNPDIVIKKWGKTSNILIKDEYEIYQKYPQFFAKIYKIDFNRQVLVQEKLDTATFINDCNQIVPSFTNISNFFRYIKRSFETNHSEPYVQQVVNNFMEYVDTTNPFFQKLYSFFKSVKKAEQQGDYVFDMNYRNFGYDKNGNIKLLDW